MKGFGKKIIFGIALIISIDVALVLMFFSEISKDLWMPELFLFAIKGGVILWLVLNVRESKRRKEENAKRKNN